MTGPIKRAYLFSLIGRNCSTDAVGCWLRSGLEYGWIPRVPSERGFTLQGLCGAATEAA